MTHTRSLMKKYYFADFTEKHYRQIIRVAKKYYSFELFTTSTKNNHILYPHARIGEIVEKLATEDFLVNCKDGLLLVTEYGGEVKVGKVFSND